jgi:hypothetical protein
VFTGVGERTREGNDLYHEMQETSVIQLDGESKVALVFGQMNEPPGARARVALTGLTVGKSWKGCAFVDRAFESCLPPDLPSTNKELFQRSTFVTKKARMVSAYLTDAVEKQQTSFDADGSNR